MIRHGEKPPKLADGEDPVGLSAQGIERAQYLPQVFGPSSRYNIQYILAEKAKKGLTMSRKEQCDLALTTSIIDGSRDRPEETVQPLAQDLGLKIHTKDRDDAEGAAEAAKGYDGHGNVLICWEHGWLAKIAEQLGVKKYADSTGFQGDEVKYPSDRFDLIWVVPSPYTEITEVLSEQVPGLDDDTLPSAG